MTEVTLSDQDVDQIIMDELGSNDDDAFIDAGTAKTGRKCKLTPQVEQDIIDCLNAGNFLTVAIEFAGVDKSTFYKWNKKGLEHPRSKYGKFRDRVRKAIRTAEVRNVSVINNAAQNGNVDAAKFWLSRKCYKRWGDKSKVELDTGDAGKITVRYSNDWQKPKVTEERSGDSSTAGTPSTDSV